MNPAPLVKKSVLVLSSSIGHRTYSKEGHIGLVYELRQ